MKTTLAVTTVLLLITTPDLVLAPNQDHGLRKLSRDTEEFLVTAQSLLDQAGQGDLEAMRQLAELFSEDRTRTGNWLYQAAIRGHQDAIGELVFDALDTDDPRYYTAWAWIQAGYRLGVLSHPNVGTNRYGGKGIHDERWFSERMKPEDLQRSNRYSDRLYRWVIESTEGTRK